MYVYILNSDTAHKAYAEERDDVSYDEGISYQSIINHVKIDISCKRVEKSSCEQRKGNICWFQ